MLACLADGARHMLRADAATVRLLDNGDTHLRVVAVSDPSAVLQHQGPTLVECSRLDREALSGHPVIVPDTRAQPQAANVPRDYRSVLCVPLVYEDSSVGTVQVYATAPQRFSQADADLLKPLADLGAAATALARALEVQEAGKADMVRFIHVATHELRSPVVSAQSLVLGVLRGYAGGLTDKQAEVLARIRRRLEFLERLINNLLDLAASQSTALEARGAVLVNASVGRTVLFLQPRAEEKDVTLTYHGCCDDLTVRGTDDGLDRVFVNLVGNAIKYTPPGGRVDVWLRRVDQEVQVEVTDTGIGIPEDALSHLFEEFYRAPNVKALDEVGTGLGLTIVKDLVDRYGGRIEVESTVGQGTTFTVTFPLFPPG